MMLDQLRAKIDAINEEIVFLLKTRMELAREVAKIKGKTNLPILDFEREKAIKEKMKTLAKSYGISGSMVEEIFDLILNYTRLEMEAHYG